MASSSSDLVSHVCTLADAGEWDEAITHLHRDFRWRELALPAEGEAVLQGAKAVRAFRRRWDGLRAEYEPQERNCFESGQWVICDTVWRTAASEEEPSNELRSADAFEVRDGKIACVRSAVLHAWTAAPVRR